MYLQNITFKLNYLGVKDISLKLDYPAKSISDWKHARVLVTYAPINLNKIILRYVPTKFIRGILNYAPRNFNIGNYLPNLFSSSHISRPKHLVSKFYLDKMLVKLNSSLLNHKCLYNSVGFNFVFNPDVATSNYVVVSLIGNRVFQIVLLSLVVYLMMEVTTFLCNGGKDKPFVIFFNLLAQCFKFINYSSKITNLTNWIRKYIYSISYKKLLYDIIWLIYNNVKSLICNLYVGCSSSVKRLKESKIKTNVSFKRDANFSYIVSLSHLPLNIIYASLTVVYIVLGWLLDYLSFTWLFMTRAMNFNYIFKLEFWVKRSVYTTLYIIWLYLGVISTNGIYFWILNRLAFIKHINIITGVVGSFLSYITSSLWYLYGRAVVPERFSIIQSIMLPLLLNTRYNGRTSNFFNNLRSLIFYYLFMPVSFNFYSSFRRSCLEWMSFTGMVFSTYLTWDLYVRYVFYSLSIVQNLVIWSIPCIVNGFILIYLEETRPRFGALLYGFVYLLYWTTCCFFTNSIILAYFNASNAGTALIYFIPINFIVGFVYLVPLYRNTVGLSTLERLVHIFSLSLLISITLISAGLIWYLIGG